MYIRRGGAMVASAPELVLACVVLPVTTEPFALSLLATLIAHSSVSPQPRSRGAIRLASADPQAAPLIDGIPSRRAL